MYLKYAVTFDFDLTITTFTDDFLKEVIQRG